MTIYQLKPRFLDLLRPLVICVQRWGVTANQLTCLTGLTSLLLGCGLYDFGRRTSLGEMHTWFALIPIWMLLRMALNAMDGMLAREHGQQSHLGVYLNELSDVVSDAALYLPFALQAEFGGFWVGVVVVLAGLSEFAGALGPMVGASRHYEGPMGKSDRALAFGCLGLYIASGWPLPAAAHGAMPAMAGLLVWTIGNRILHGVREVQHLSSPPPRHQSSDR